LADVERANCTQFPLSVSNFRLSRPKRPSEKNPAQGAKTFPCTAFSQWLSLGFEAVVDLLKVHADDRADSIAEAAMAFRAVIGGTKCEIAGSLRRPDSPRESILPFSERPTTYRDDVFQYFGTIELSLERSKVKMHNEQAAK
jgi:hypothetical protein